ncbi:hypothetical protein [Sporichthya polymorpha]|uniref:hypothetical protein n=1 Tax=Sporichthya polymorpha TaxID=35751 RepID=UPI0012EBE69E|nr:hypothetical protein [Sporichthya polymorpha]
MSDPAGRPVLGPEPGLLTFAVAARRDPSPDPREHAQPLPGGLRSGPAVLVGLASPEQGAGLVGLWPGIAAALARPGEGDVLADLGRLHPGSPAIAIAAAADTLVGVACGDAAGILRIRDRLTHLITGLPPTDAAHTVQAGHVGGRRVVVVLVVEDRHAVEAVASTRAVLEHAALPVTVAGYLALDAAAVHALSCGQRGARLDRSLLIRSARALVPHLNPDLPPPVVAPPGAERSPGRLAALVRSR